MPEGDPYAYLREALENIRAFNANPDVDEVETEQGEKITSLIQSILAGVQKDEEGLMQGKMTPRAMSRSYGGGQAQAAAPAGGQDPLAALLGG